jgi:exosome complex component RRP4
MEGSGALSTLPLDRVFVTPGEKITEVSEHLRGHGTYIKDDIIYSAVAGVVERINKLVSVRPFRARYTGEVGDLVIGRIVEVAQKRWKVDIKGRQEAILLLSSINLPGGILRRKSESDELKMREFFKEGDLVSAEIQQYFSDGSIAIHTRSLRYGKLRGGILVQVPSVLIRRCKSHFHSLPMGVDIIIALNGALWIGKTVPRDMSLHGLDNEMISSDKLDHEVGMSMG